MRILLVEDDPWSSRIAATVLHRRGHVVDARATFESAREALAGGHDLVLLDINLPGGTGDDLLAEIRARDTAVPVIAVTSLAMTGDRERFLRRGFTAYLSKPIDVRTFGQTVESYGRRP